MLTPLFKPEDFLLELDKTKPGIVHFCDNEYSFKCPHCQEEHTVVCWTPLGAPMLLTMSVGPSIKGGFPLAGFSQTISQMIEPNLPREAGIIPCVFCPNANSEEMSDTLDKRGEVMDGFRAITRAVIDYYKPSKIVTVDRHCYEVVTGRSVPDAWMYHAYSFLGDIPVCGLPDPEPESLAPFRRKRFISSLKACFGRSYTKPVYDNVQMKAVQTAEDAAEAEEKLRAGRFVYFDVEFAGDPYGANFRLLCLCAACPDTNVVYKWSESNLKNPDTAGPLINLLKDKNVKKGAHSAKAEWLACTRHFPELRESNGRTKLARLHADSMLLVYLLGIGSHVPLRVCTEYVGLGGQKDEAGDAVKGASSMVRVLRKAVLEGQPFEEALEDYRIKLTKKLSAKTKKGLVDEFKSNGYPLKVSRVMADELISSTGRGEETRLTPDWLALHTLYGNPVDSQLLRDAVADTRHDPERYTYGLINTDLLENYCAKDVFTGCKVAVWAGSKVVKEQGLKDTWFEILAPGTEVISQIERNGLPTDISRLQTLIEQVKSEMASLETQLRGFGFEGELSKNADIANFLFNKLGLKPQVFTKKKKVSVNKEAVEALIEQAPDSPVMRLLQAYKEVSKVNDSFGEKLLIKVESDGLIHANFNTDGTTTGRLSADTPNLQQLPSRGNYGKLIKRCFVGIINGKKGVFIQLDFSQIEVRIAAALSGDKAMTEAFKSGEDFHTKTAVLVWGEPITKDQRRAAKAINFGFIFNKSVAGLAEELGKTLIETQAIYDGVLGKFPDLQQKRKDWEDFARKNGYCNTYFWDPELGIWKTRRIRHMLDIDHKFGDLKSKAKNGSVNTPIQGTAGDYTIASLIKIQEWLDASGVEAKIVLTVHDSICLVSSFEDALKVASNCQSIMQNWLPNGVPVVADCEIGLDYGHGIPFKDVVAGASMLSEGMSEEDVGKVTGVLPNEEEFVILKHLSKQVKAHLNGEDLAA